MHKSKKDIRHKIFCPFLNIQNININLDPCVKIQIFPFNYIAKVTVCIYPSHILKNFCVYVKDNLN